jgi:hypothetical protein
MLKLYYATVDSYAVCTWNMNFDLCPDTCTFFYPHIENIGGQQVLGTANWEIRNSSQQTVANGSFTLDTGTQAVSDTVCLTAGLYTYKVTNVNMTAGGAKYTGVYGDNMNVSSPLTAFNNTVDSLQLNLYEACQQTANVREITKGLKAISVYSYQANVFIQNISGRPIGNVSVYDMDGRIVYRENIQRAMQQIDLSGLPQGIYIIRVVNNAGSDMSKVMIGD